jgi:hypothetical protein
MKNLQEVTKKMCQFWHENDGDRDDMRALKSDPNATTIIEILCDNLPHQIIKKLEKEPWFNQALTILFEEFDLKRFDWFYNRELVVYFPRFFKKWFDPEKFNWDKHSRLFSKYCQDFTNIWGKFSIPPVKKKAIVVINEAHSLMEEQKEILKKKYEEVQKIKVPVSGWTKKEMDEVGQRLVNKYICPFHNDFQDHRDIIFLSPVPYLLKTVSGMAGTETYAYRDDHHPVKVFHNDKREKKELPNGKLISVVAKTGWVLA